MATLSDVVVIFPAVAAFCVVITLLVVSLRFIIVSWRCDYTNRKCCLS
jgi:hypothetical protein